MYRSNDKHPAKSNTLSEENGKCQSNIRMDLDESFGLGLEEYNPIFTQVNNTIHSSFSNSDTEYVYVDDSLMLPPICGLDYQVVSDDRNRLDISSNNRPQLGGDHRASEFRQSSQHHNSLNMIYNGIYEGELNFVDSVGWPCSQAQETFISPPNILPNYWSNDNILSTSSIIPNTSSILPLSLSLSSASQPYFPPPPSPSISCNFFHSKHTTIQKDFPKVKHCPPHKYPHKYPHTKDGANRIFECQFVGCSRTFKRLEHLKRHLNSVHYKIKPYKCPIENCEKWFARSDNRSQHVKHAHITRLQPPI